MFQFSLSNAEFKRRLYAAGLQRRLIQYWLNTPRSGPFVKDRRLHRRLSQKSKSTPFSSLVNQNRCWDLNHGDDTGSTPWYYDGPLDNHPARAANLLALLQACRLVYTETMPLLYRDNVFNADHPDTLIYLRRSVLARRLDRIRVLNFTRDFKWHTAASPVPYDSFTSTKPAKCLPASAVHRCLPCT